MDNWYFLLVSGLVTPSSNRALVQGHCGHCTVGMTTCVHSGSRHSIFKIIRSLHNHVGGCTELCGFASVSTSSAQIQGGLSLPCHAAVTPGGQGRIYASLH